MTKTKRELAHLLPIAENLAEELRAFCERIEIAGSLRRRTSHAGDVELVAIPRFGDIVTPDLFGDGRVTKSNLLWTQLDSMETSEEISYSKQGNKYRQFRLYGETQVDLFTAQPGNWGWIFLIRTGSADFSRGMAISLNRAGYTSKQGWVIDLKTDERIETPNEEDVFKRAGRSWVRPEDRI